jgi:hypothetical protein
MSDVHIPSPIDPPHIRMAKMLTRSFIIFLAAVVGALCGIGLGILVIKLLT